MRSFKILAASAMLIVGVFAFNVSAAQATPHSGACVFTGVTGNITPTGAGRTGVEALVPDILDSGPGDPRNDTDKGTYTFGGSAQCSLDNGTPGTASISANGSYDSTTCGTGEAPGTASVTSTPANATGVTYKLHFDAGQGQLDITGGTLTTNADGQTHSPIDGSGAVSISPTVGHGNCVTQDVDQFTVEGSFSYSAP